MKSIRIFASAVLLFAVLLSVIPAGAVSPSDQMQNSLGLVGTGGTLRDTGNGVSFSVSGFNSSILYNFRDGDIFAGANTLSIVLSNYSLCEEIRLEACYQDGEIYTSYIKMEQYSTLKTYTVDVPKCESIAQLYLYFDGISSGEIIIYSITCVSLFSQNVEAIGEVSECIYNAGAVTVKGTLRHSSVISHGNAKLALYALGINDTLEDIFSGDLAPIFSGGSLSIRFEFTVPVKTVSERLKKYVVAVVDGDAVHLIDNPRYPTVRAEESELLFKGVSSSLDFVTLESGAGLSVIDVDLSALISDRNNGYFYTVDENRYFFDRNQVNALDERVRNLSNSSVQVLLRLRGLGVFSSTELRLKAYAVVHFLCTRYSSSANGEVFGIILGDSLNERVSESLTLSQYVSGVYDLFYTVLAAADDSNQPTLAIIPLSEAWGERPEPTRVSSDLFCEALFSVFGYYGETRFAVMPETKKNPYGINDDYIKGLGDPENLGEKLTKSQPDCNYISSDNIARFYRGYEYLCEKYLDNMPKVIYSWTPAENTTQSALSAAYVYNYYKLFFARYINAFVVSFEGSQAEEASAFADVKHKIKYIDTEKSLEVGDFARDIFGIEDWNDEIVSFKAESVKTRNVKDNMKLGVGVPLGVKGTYSYWNFDSQSSFAGWYSGYGYSSLTVENVGQNGKALTATGKKAEEISGEYGYIAYKYDFEENFRYNDYLLIELSMNAAKGDIFEISIMVGGAEFLYEFRSEEITSGKKYTLYLDVSDLTEKSTIEYIKIGSKALGSGTGEHKLSVYSISAASTRYIDEDLKELILAERERIHSDEGGLGKVTNFFWIIVVVSAVSVTVAVMIMVERKRRNARPEERA